MKAFIYCRQSSGDDDFSESIEVQKNNCLKLAKEKKIEVLDCFSDLNLSGKLYPAGYNELASKDIIYQNWIKTVSSRKTERPGLGKLFERLKEVDLIIVDDYTRLARPLTGSFLDSVITQILFVDKIKILTAKNGEIDLNSFNDSLITSLQNRINDNQIAIQRKKAKDSLKSLKDSGVSIQSISLVFGFEFTGRKHEIQLVHEKVNVVKFIYKSFLEGVSISKITRDVNSKYPNLFNGKYIQFSTIRKILLRPFYCGYIFDSNNQLIKSKQLEGLAFIDFSVWKKVQEKLSNRKKVPFRAKQKWLPLSGMLQCGCCGKKLIFKKNKDKFGKYYCIRHVLIDKTSCGVHITNSIKNEAGLGPKPGLGLIEVISPILILGAYDMLQKHLHSEDTKKQLNELNVQLSNIKEKSKKITNLFISDIISEDVATEQLNSLRKEEKELKNKITSIEATLSEETDIEHDRRLINKIVHGNITHEEFEELLNKTVKKIIVFKEKVIIQTYFGDVELPQLKHRNYWVLPRFTFNNNENGTYDLYYYNGTNPIVNIYAKDQKTIFDSNGMKIKYVKMKQKIDLNLGSQ